MKKILILINRLSENPTADEYDVILQAQYVEKALEQLDFSPHRLFVDLNFQALNSYIKEDKPALVFNLVESLNGEGGLVHLVPSILESMGVPFTGNPSDALFLTTQKPLAKKLMTAHGIPTPKWFDGAGEIYLDPDKRYIVKPSREDASVGITDTNVIYGIDDASLQCFRKKWGTHFFIEEFIEGREFNISLLGSKNGPEVLPPAEIRFINYPAGKPTIIGYEAKWDESAFEYSHTVRTFDIQDSDPSLMSRIKRICLDCWDLFHLRGYVRIDFRVDAGGDPWVLEINANPCIAPDSGFVAATEKKGMDSKEVIQRIVEDL